MKTVATVAFGLVALASIVSAHPLAYVNVTGDDLLFCDATIPEVTGITAGFGQGGVCFDAGHIVADASGGASVSIADDNLGTASGFYCQDKDADGTCDADTASIFCSSFALTDGVNWNSAFGVLVFADGPVFGNPALSACGLTVSASVQGKVSHT